MGMNSSLTLKGDKFVLKKPLTSKPTPNAKGRNVFAERKHIALSEVTEENIGDVFAYCNVAGKMRLVRRVPASIDPKALTLEFMAPA